MTLLLALACTGKPEEPAERGPKRAFESLADPRYPEPPTFAGASLLLAVPRDEDDGTLSAVFHPDGADGINRASGGERIVLRFDPPDTLLGVPLASRLQLPVLARGGEGPVELRIQGLVDDGSPLTAATPRTAASVGWTIPEPWPDPFAAMPKKARRTPVVCAPFDRASPDLTPILAELGTAGWASRPVTLVIEAIRGELLVQDSLVTEEAECPGRLAPQLELFPSVRSLLVGKELLGRPTDRSVTVSLLSLVDLEVAVELTAGDDRRVTPVVAYPAGSPIEVRVDGLAPSTEYRWWTRYRRPGAATFELGPEGSFFTARAKGEPFSFTVTADGHFLNMEHRRAFASMHLLRSTMARIAASEPDFHLDLGDSLNSESYRSFDAPDDEEVLRRDLAVRPYFEQLGAPLFLVLGNHEGEQGWRIARGDGLVDRATRARQLVYPNPVPNDFVSSATDAENSFAFTWGDVLVVVLDPYRYTVRKPHDMDGVPGEGDRWDWTLGKAQYDWLVRTLEQSDARYKLVFSHQITGGTNGYGRGGRLGAETFEWGGAAEFAERRPGWGRPIHRVFADSGVTAFVHGHDHVFAFEPPLDGVGYVTAPQPGDARYDEGHAPRTGIAPGSTVIENSGYLRFTTSGEGLRLEYVRSFLPGDGEDGAIAFSHLFPAERVTGRSAAP